MSCDQSVCNLELDRKYGCVLYHLYTRVAVDNTDSFISHRFKSGIKVRMDFMIELVICHNFRSEVDRP